MHVFAELIDLIRDVVSKLLLTSALSTACLGAEGCLTTQFLLNFLYVRKVIKTRALRDWLLCRYLILDQDLLRYLLINLSWGRGTYSHLWYLLNINALVKQELSRVHFVLSCTASVSRE